MPRATLRVLWARGLTHTSAYDKNDVFAIVKWNGKEVGRTAVVEDSDEPVVREAPAVRRTRFCW